MDAMPDKVLITESLIDGDGEVCAIGAVCKSRGLDVSKTDCYCPDSVGKLVGISRIMAAEIAYENDEHEEWKRFGDSWKRWAETPAERWVRMRQWVTNQIKE
jgi:hypothetical protein